MPSQSETAVYGTSILPIITTKKIHLSSKERTVKIDFALNRRIGSNTVVNADISEMYYFYFIILTEQQAGLIPLLKDPDTRGRAIKRIYLGHHDNIFQEGAIKKVRYSEVLNNHETINYNTTDLSNDYENEFRSFAIIDYAPIESRQGSRIPYENLDTSKLHLVCFMDIDLVEASSVGNDTIYYDLLLERNNITGRLDVPRNINSFYVNNPTPLPGGSVPSGANNMKPYHGPVHYHPPQPEDPEAYVGWMAGHLGPNMGPRLEVVQTPNYKVTSDLKAFETQITTTSTTGESTEGPSWFNDHLLPGSNLKNELRHNNVIKSAASLVQDMERHSRTHVLKIPNIVDYESQNMSFVNYIADPNNRDQAPLGNSHHGFAISIDFLEIIKYRSRLGHLVDFHQHVSNDAFVSKTIARSRIKNISFYRQRVVNVPYEINERQSTIYSKYDDNEYGEYIISSSDGTADQSNGRLLESTTDLGSLEEVSILQAFNSPNGIELQPAPEQSRQFIVRDKDLFNNINYGKYTYTVKIILEDGIEKTISELHNTAKRLLLNYEKFLFYASIPYRQSLDPENSTGSYDFSHERFSRAFRTRIRNKQTIDSAIDLYFNMKVFLTGLSLEDLSEERLELRSRMNLNTAKLQDILEFRNILSEMTGAIKSILSQGIELTSKRKKENFKSSIKNASGANLKVIEITAKTNVISEAIGEGVVVEDFNPAPSRPFHFPSLDELPDFFASTSIGDYVFPSQFLTITPASYDPLDAPSIGVGSTKSEANRSRKRKSRKRKTRRKSGSVNILLNSREYNKMSKIKKSNFNIKINYLLKAQSDKHGHIRPIGEEDKPLSFYPLASQRYFGGISLGTSDGTINNFSGGIRDVAEALDYVDSGLSDEVKKVICDSVYKQDDRDFFLDEIERRYEELSSLRDTLGSFYDYAHSLLTVREDSLIANNGDNRSYEEKFNDNTSTSTATANNQSDVFQNRARPLEIISPNLIPKLLNLRSAKFQVPRRPVESMKRVVCVKMKNYENTNLSVNDVLFLEV